MSQLHTDEETTVGSINRHCENCGDDVRLADDPALCGHDYLEYCSPECCRADCVVCYGEHHSDF